MDQGQTSTAEHQSAPRNHRRTPDARLVGLNLILAGVLGVLTLTSPGPAQPQDRAQAPPRPRGEYTMLSGQYKGGTSSAIFVLDAANQELVALRWNRSAKRFEPIGFRSVADDARFFRGAR